MNDVQRLRIIDAAHEYGNAMRDAVRAHAALDAANRDTDRDDRECYNKFLDASAALDSAWGNFLSTLL